MSYWGDGAPTVKLLDNQGVQVEAVVLPVPTARLFQDWEPEWNTFPDTLDYSDADDLRGYRLKAGYLWVGLSATDMSTLLKVLRWTGPKRLWIHSDGIVRCLVKAKKVKHDYPMGIVYHDAMEIEFIGVNLVPEYPDPAMMVVGRLVMDSAHIMTAESPTS